MKVLIRGRVSVYEPSGQYQLYAEDMQPEGVGALSLAYEQLKARLEAEGLFAQELKKPIPAFPQRIGVVTSPTGAAVRDILQITARRWPLAEILLAPVLVQGDRAPREISGALEALDRYGSCDVIILGRGGGSLEDLWAFNEEAVARAVGPVLDAGGLRCGPRDGLHHLRLCGGPAGPHPQRGGGTVHPGLAGADGPSACVPPLLSRGGGQAGGIFAPEPGPAASVLSSGKLPGLCKGAPGPGGRAFPEAF